MGQKKVPEESGIQMPFEQQSHMEAQEMLIDITT